MKNILCLLIILFVSIGVYAQEEEKVVTGAQFDAIYKGSLAAWSLEDWKGKSFRRTIITRSSVEGRPQTDYSSKTTVEYASPTNTRGVYETSFGDKSSRTESIRIGDKFYIRKDGGDWKEGSSESRTVTGGKAAPEEIPASREIEYKFLGTEKLNNQTANVYVENVKTKRINAADNQETVTTATIKYWFGEDGKILKSEMVSESRTKEKTYRTLLTQIWEADEAIKIVAPTVSTAQKQ